MGRDRWEKETLRPSLSSNPERDAVQTLGPKRLNVPEDIPAGETEWPGEFPYTRGIHPTGYRGRFWTMRQYAGFGTATESNARYRYLLEQGTSGLSVAFDLPTQIGYDSDHPLAQGEVGKVGVAIDSLRDMTALFDDVPLDRVSTSMTINAPAAVLLALYVAVAKQQGVAPAKLRGTVQNDILKEYIARGTYIWPPRESLRLTTDLMAWCATEVPQWNTISISGYHIREAGSTAVQELAFTLADGIAYVEAALARGMEVDDFAPRLAFFFNCHNDLLTEVAKFRAARRMWAHIMRDRFGARDERSLRLRFHTQTAGSSLSAQQPWNNVTRTAVQALAAVLGGTQSLHTNALDEALGLPSEKAAQLALRTQQIIAHETGIANLVDPLAGSWTIEARTDELVVEAEALIGRIDDMGGMLPAIEQGWVQAQIAEAAFAYQQQVERGERTIVGVNAHTEDSTPEAKPLAIDASVATAHANALEQLRASRGDVTVPLETLGAAANGDENLLPNILVCVEAEATLGEICDTLRAAWGEYRPTT